MSLRYSRLRAFSPRLDQIRCDTPTGKASPRRRPPTPYTADEEQPSEMPDVNNDLKRGISEETTLDTPSSRQGPTVPPK